jgi:2-polyprenyl-3-methyl-5-hydroxy-6-metoxy-1,4-benzoquinol methylase
MGKKITLKKLYSIWAKDYDLWPSVRGIMDEKGILKIIGNVKGKEILDLGCGTGKWSIILNKKGAKVTSVDNSKEMLDVLNKKIKLEKLKINTLKKDISKLKLNKKFDIIVMGLVMNHIKNLDKLFKIIRAHLKSGGIFLMSDPVYFPEVKKPTTKEIKILENKYRVKQYVHPEQEIKGLAKKNGLTIMEIKKLAVDNSVKYLFDKKPHKPFSESKGKHVLTIYKFTLKNK